MFNFLIFLATLLLAYAFYKWATKNNNFFEKNGVPYMKPTFLLGNVGGFLMKQYTAHEFCDLLYNACPGKKINGMFDFRKPSILLRDPDVIKQLTIKDFEYFEDKRSFVNEADDFIGNTLLLLKGAQWHEMRSTLSPAFTGSKIRLMFDLIADNSMDLAAHLKKQKTALEFNMKDLFAKLAMDMVANSAFGVKINSFEDDKNEFYVTAKNFLNFTNPFFFLRMLLLNTLPKVARYFDIGMLSSEVRNFFMGMVMSNIQTREKQGIFRPDLINMLMNLRKGKKTENEKQSSNIADGFAAVDEINVRKVEAKSQWTDSEIVAQCFIFFFAGFETISNHLSFVSHELATNPDIQERLYQEIADMESLCNGKKLTYEQLQKMKYLDMVTSESLRKWPPIALIDRLCVKDYNYDDGDVRIRITKGMPITIPTMALHRDEQYYPNPGQFDPERFSDENKKNIRQGTYLPFGIGPRNCIGSRLALMEAKVVLYYLLLNFKMVPYHKTQIPLKLARTPMGMHAEKGIYLKFETRNAS